jgi:uncharacterized protein YhbP (UPF0306 family)
MVISSFGETYPESAVVEYASDGLTIIFDTDKSSRKYNNFIKNSKVSIVVGWDNDVEEETLQCHGKCELLDGDELDRLKKVYFAKNPGAQKWEHEKSTAYFKVELTWLRHTDLKTYPWAITEITNTSV